MKSAGSLESCPAWDFEFEMGGDDARGYEVMTVVTFLTRDDLLPGEMSKVSTE